MANKLFYSSKGMENAVNYNRWTYEQFSDYIRGDVLEVGCGVGSFTDLILKGGGFRKLLSIDMSAEAISYCKKRFKHTSLELKCMDVMHINSKFDLVICMNVLEHLKDDGNALRHMFSLLNDRGVLFLLVPAHKFLFSSFDELGGHYRRYTRKDILTLIRNNVSMPSLYIDQYYFNLVGAIGYYFTYKIIRKQPRIAASSEISLYDKLIVPLQKRFACRMVPFGISLITIIRKG